MARRAKFAWAFAPLIVVACSGPGSSESTQPEDGESDDALIPASCTVSEGRRYETMLAGDASCESVSAERGTWLARRIFPDGPESVRDRACRFTWRGERGASPDRSALENATGESRLAATCAKGAPATVEPDSVDAGPDPGEIAPMGGAVGCDVCGLVERGKLWVVRPPEVDRIRFRASLADTRGRIVETRSFAVAATRGPAMVVNLPEAPVGKTWVEGRVAIR